MSSKVAYRKVLVTQAICGKSGQPKLRNLSVGTCREFEVLEHMAAVSIANLRVAAKETHQQTRLHAVPLSKMGKGAQGSDYTVLKQNMWLSVRNVFSQNMPEHKS